MALSAEALRRETRHDGRKSSARANRLIGSLAARLLVLPSHPEYAKLEAIRVAIIHPGVPSATGSGWHIEDVVECRKGPSQRFFIHTT